jgi:hypothetical protein
MSRCHSLRNAFPASVFRSEVKKLRSTGQFHSGLHAEFSQ